MALIGLNDLLSSVKYKRIKHINQFSMPKERLGLNSFETQGGIKGRAFEPHGGPEKHGPS